MKKIIFWAVVAAAATELTNRLIFRNARKSAEATQHLFKWRHGCVHYAVYGKGRPLLLIHGIGPGRSGHEWEPAANILSRRRRVYVLDLPGFGRSESTKTDYSAYLYAALILRFIRKVIRRPASVAAEGQSGAFAAAACAMEPEWFKSVTLISPDKKGPWRPRTAAGRKVGKFLAGTPVLGTALYNILTSPIVLRGYGKDLFSDPDFADAGLLKKMSVQARSGGPDARFLLRSYLAGYMDALPDPERLIGSTGIPVRTIRERGLPHLENPRAFCMEHGKYF
jgi:pimeloyl-ACP methyl ester carboxylesterase